MRQPIHPPVKPHADAARAVSAEMVAREPTLAAMYQTMTTASSNDRDQFKRPARFNRPRCDIARLCCSILSPSRIEIREAQAFASGSDRACAMLAARASCWWRGKDGCQPSGQWLDAGRVGCMLDAGSWLLHNRQCRMRTIHRKFLPVVQLYYNSMPYGTVQCRSLLYLDINEWYSAIHTINGTTTGMLSLRAH